MFIAKLNEVLASKRSFIADPLNTVSIGITAALNIIHWLILYIKIKPGDANILLHYNVIYGRDLIGKSSYIYLIPATALLFLIVNILIAGKFYKSEKLAAYFLNFASIAVQLIFLAATLVLIIA